MPNKLKTRASTIRRVPDTAELRPTTLTPLTRSQQRAADLLAREIRFIPATEFQQLDGDNSPIDTAIELVAALRASSIEEQEFVTKVRDPEAKEMLAFREWASDAPLLTFEQEQTLFRALNLLRFRVNRLRSRLSPSRPSRRSMDAIEKMLEVVEEIRSQLVNSNLRLVASIARRFSMQNGDVDDFSSDGSMILLGAIDRFDYSRGYRFSTYATHSIQRHFYRACRVRQRRKERFPNANSECLSEIANPEADAAICKDPERVVSNLMEQASSLLDEREKEILLHRFGINRNQGRSRTLREVAEDLGLSKERVRQLQLKALEKLKDLLDPAQFFCDAALPCQ